jgi:CDP-paratose 2-epimerase
LPPSEAGYITSAAEIEARKSLQRVSERILVTGGAGFVGSNLALSFKRDRPSATVIAFDNLKRRGSELALPRLRAGGVEFMHGDIRSADDLAAAGAVGLLIEASAEPSVHAGYGGDPNYLVHTNLFGAANCLEHARRHGADFVFLSSSRVYPIDPLRALPLEPTQNRFVLPAGFQHPGVSTAGIAESFPLAGHRSLYGASKLAAEFLVEEYRAMYGLRTIVNRCGVLSGPWQMGKVDQGFVVLWLARHLFGGPLAYMGFGGRGLQVRDVLHVDDLYDLIVLQLSRLDELSGHVFNVGGGAAGSISLRELTAICQKLSGHSIAIGEVAETRDADIPYYVSDCAAVTAATGWRPKRPLQQLFDDVWRWLVDNRAQLEPILALA